MTDFSKATWCPNCEKAFVYEPPLDGKCKICGAELTPIPPYSAPLPE
jgi:DNA polymerase II large subunit